MVELTISQPITEGIYYRACGKLIGTICSAKNVSTSKKLGTKYWSKRFNLSVFAMNAVKVWLVYQGINRTADAQADFYNYMAEEMIYNT